MVPCRTQRVDREDVDERILARSRAEVGRRPGRSARRRPCRSMIGVVGPASGLRQDRAGARPASRRRRCRSRRPGCVRVTSAAGRPVEDRRSGTVVSTSAVGGAATLPDRRGRTCQARCSGSALSVAVADVVEVEVAVELERVEHPRRRARWRPSRASSHGASVPLIVILTVKLAARAPGGDLARSGELDRAEAAGRPRSGSVGWIGVRERPAAVVLDRTTRVMVGRGLPGIHEAERQGAGPVASAQAAAGELMARLTRTSPPPIRVIGAR